MSLDEWMKRWLIIVLICLFLIGGCGIYLVVNDLKKDQEQYTSYVINQVRVEVNDLLISIEEEYQNIEHDLNVQNKLQQISDEQRIDVIVSQLDGKVIFNSIKDNSTSYINIKNDLHYDLYSTKVEEDKFKIAFPVVDENTHNQVGNVIFLIDKNKAYAATSNLPLSFIIMICLSLLIIFLLGLLYMLKYKYRMDVIQPIQKLKKSTEEILKGNYEQPTEYKKSDELGELYAVFEQMRIEIMELSQQRDEQERNQKQLVSSISHDIKTPLTTLKAYLDAIYEGVCPDRESMMEYVKIMRNNTEKMSRLVDDLFTHTLKALDHIPVYPKEQYSKKVLENIIMPIGHYVQTIGINFIGPKEIPNVLIKIDENRLDQVISNLIANSLKHTSQGDTISISIDIEKQMMKIHISDSGQGIHPQDMPFIFERYFRGSTTTQTSLIKNDGSGLGLSICKHIMEAHAGTIEFKSKKNVGTVFTLSLPIS